MKRRTYKMSTSVGVDLDRVSLLLRDVVLEQTGAPASEASYL